MWGTEQCLHTSVKGVAQVMKFLTSDLHIGHANIIEYTDRPYASVDEMNTDLVERWNSVVSPDDEVFILGDLAMGKLADSLALIPSFNGAKHLVPGNHDRMFGCKTEQKYDNACQRYVDAGIADVLPSRLSIELTEDMTVLATHFPYSGDSREGPDRYEDQRPEDKGDRLIHGHTHGLWRRNGRMVDVGVDAWAGYPVSFQKVRDIFLWGDEHAKPVEWVRV